MLLITEQHNGYIIEMYRDSGENSTQKEATTPLQFDQTWFKHDHMRNLKVVNEERSLKLGRWEGDTWAPDFPQVRPSPTAFNHTHDGGVHGEG